ncbi:MAG: tetratricopeptide repeat protein [Halorubrum sp.]
MEEAPALVEVVQRRLDFLETLTENSFRKHELVDELGCSRSTVNRAVDELEAEQLVTRETDGYRTTLTGRLLASSYRSFLRAAGDIDGARGVLAPLGADVDLSPALFRDADTYRAAGPDPYRPLERLDEAVLDADSIDVALPTLPYPRLFDRLREVGSDGDDHSVTLALDTTLYRHARERFSSDLSALAGRVGVSVAAATSVEVGLVVTETVAITVVFDDDGGLHGIAESRDPKAIAWARRQVRSFVSDSNDVTGELSELSGATGSAARGRGFVGTASEERDTTLASQGFSVIDDDRLGRDVDPTGALRASPRFAEVAAGGVLTRTRPVADGENRRAISDRLVDGLTDGTDHALVGPPGSGKSTTCREVAVRWHRSGRGSVLYRRGDADSAFTAVESLRERVSNADGHTLVVVEDAVDPAAARTMTVARGLADRPDVSFLFDAREEAYDDPDGLPLGPADLAHRRRVETVRMPRLDEREVERFIDHVDGLSDVSLSVDPATLLETIRGQGGGGPDGSGGQGEVSRLVHRLAYSFVPVHGDTGTHSSLEDEVARAVREFDDRPSPTMDVAVLVNLLNVARIDDPARYAYALLGDTVDSTGDAGDVDHEGPERIRRALERLVGTVFVSGVDDTARTVHEEWSVLFLERLLEREPEPVVARRVGRIVTRVLSLADDPTRRSRIRRAFGGDAPEVDEIERDPETWAESTTTAIYGVGRAYPRLAGLYGRVRYSWIDLPSALPDGLRDRPAEWVSRMHIDAGDLDRATDALDAWRPASAAGEAERQRGFGDVARRRGEHDVAMDHFDRAAELFREADDREGLAAAVRGRGQAAHFAGEYETAYEASSRAYAIAAELGDPIAVAKSLMLVANALDAMGNDETVVSHYRFARALFRAYDDVHGAANVSANLCVTYRRRGDVSAAVEAGKRALDGYRTVGDRHRESVVLLNLGAIAEQRGAADRARERYRAVRSLADQVGAEPNRGMALNGLGSVALATGELDRAERTLRDALDVFEEGNADHRRAMVLVNLAEVALERGNLEAADRELDRAAALLVDHEGRKCPAGVGRVRGMVALARGELTDAESTLSAALGDAEVGGFTGQKTEILAALGGVAAERGDVDLALERLTDALSEALEYECARAIVAAAERLAPLLVDCASNEVAIGDGIAVDAERCRELATRWQIGGESDAASSIDGTVGGVEPAGVSPAAEATDAVEVDDSVSEPLSDQPGNPEHE